MADFLDQIERLFSPIDAWGEFRRGARKAAVAFVLADAGPAGPSDIYGVVRLSADPDGERGEFAIVVADGMTRTITDKLTPALGQPFVRRRADLRDHPGQVALPGGGVRDGESAWEGAQREVAEEIGVPVGRLDGLGAGQPFYTAVSNFSVVPFVAHLPEPPAAFIHDETELEGIIHIPLERLLDDTAWLTSDTQWKFRYLAHEESVVWGLTERIVAGLAPRLRQALSETS